MGGVSASPFIKNQRMSRILEITLPSQELMNVALDPLSMPNPTITPKGLEVEIFRAAVVGSSMDDEFHIRVKDSRGYVWREKVAIPLKQTRTVINLLPSSGADMNGNNMGVIDKMSERMYFLENLTDLWIGGHIDKDRYAKFRKLFKTNEREFAIKMVSELHEHHVNN
jgi:hypothetical protein